LKIALGIMMRIAIITPIMVAIAIVAMSRTAILDRTELLKLDYVPVASRDVSMGFGKTALVK